MDSDLGPVRFDTKIAVLLRDDLAGRPLLNVTAFLVSGLGTRVPELVGEPYADADGTRYLPMFRQPVLVLAGSKEILTTAHRRAVDRGVPLSVFTSDLFRTGNDRDNRAAARAVGRDQLDLTGLAVHGPRAVIDKVEHAFAQAAPRGCHRRRAATRRPHDGAARCRIQPPAARLDGLH